MDILSSESQICKKLKPIRPCAQRLFRNGTVLAESCVRSLRLLVASRIRPSLGLLSAFLMFIPFSRLFSRYLILLSAVCCLLQTLAPETSAAQHFDEKIVAAWKAYEQFAQSLQGKKRTVFHYIDRKDHVLSVRYRQNPEGCLTIDGRNDDPYETVKLTNPIYSAELRKNIAPDTVVLTEINLLQGAALRADGGIPLLEGVFLGISPHFRYWETKLSVLQSQPSFSISSISMVPYDGEEWMRVQFRYLENQKSQKIQREGSIYLDPHRHWCLRQIMENENIFRGDNLYRTMVWTTEYEIIDHPSGFPIIKTEIKTYDGTYQMNNRKSKGFVRSEFKLEVDNRVPTSEFTLSAFGLPEPMGAAPLPQSHTWVWLLVATVAAVALAILFAWLKRRQTRMIARSSNAS